MVHYHYYIIAGAQCDESTRILKVAVGTSKQSQRDYVFLQAYALQHKHFFHIVDQPTVIFVDKVRRSLVEWNIQVEYISCRDLVREMKNQQRHPLDAILLHQQHTSRKVLSLNYRVSSNLARRAQRSAKRAR